MHYNGAKHKKAEKAAGGGAALSSWKAPAPAATAASIPPPGRCLRASTSSFRLDSPFFICTVFETFP